MKERNYHIDLLKIISSIAVVGLHTLCGTNNMIYNIGYLLCGFAIPSFMLASGYLAYKNDNFRWNNSIKKIKKCITFIFIWVVLSIVIKKVGLLIRNEEADIVYWMKVIFSPLLNEGLLWHFWYIISLMIMHILFPLFIWLKKKDIILNCWVLFALTSATLHICSLIAGQSIQQNIPQYLRIWTWVQYWLLGESLHLLLPKTQESGYHKKELKRIFKWCFALYTIGYIMLQLFISNSILSLLLAEVFYDDLLEIIWIALFFIMILSLKLNDKLISFIQLLAPLTYGVYIIHPFVMKFTSKIAMEVPVILWITTVLFSFAIVAILIHIPLIKKIVTL